MILFFSHIINMRKSIYIDNNDVILVRYFSNKHNGEHSHFAVTRTKGLLLNGQNEIRSTLADLGFVTGDAGNLAVKLGKEPSSSARTSSSKLRA